MSGAERARKSGERERGFKKYGGTGEGGRVSGAGVTKRGVSGNFDRSRSHALQKTNFSTYFNEFYVWGKIRVF